ncbi:hypothetical protein HY29_01950 [Hyphomonas beringensis]|uniref:Multidrug export protein MepA n=1 Tax=Hyphomonas beringensis TaxID=1280946 RepID=A0A062UEF6_9PROT|nr:MATE family efflux transporter [Hyphomonas beringensis]KCZ54994.1 hypothetical protein HY29_01950 [Hyphomonas beringensis]
MSLRPSPENKFLYQSPLRVFLANALPMMLIMLMNGLLNIIDAAFLGHFVGADAMTAIGLAFPVIMVLIAISTLVSGGMSSLLARQLGAGDMDAACATFARAHGLALVLSAITILIFACFSPILMEQLAASDDRIAQMALVYLGISVAGTPLQFALGLHADTWRNEGRAGLVAMLSVGVTFANIILNYVLIRQLNMGVAGSAWGTVLAQGAGLGLLLLLRARGLGTLPLSSLLRNRWRGDWPRILALGAPLSLSFIGMALVSFCVILALRLTAAEAYAETIAAYGIVTRVMGFAFLPNMAFALALQSVAGNNWGAGYINRAQSALKAAMLTGFVYCIGMELLFQFAGHSIAQLFIQDAQVTAQVATILRYMAAFYFLTGPILVIALYCQAIGRPIKAALLTLTKAFLLLPALIATLAVAAGAPAVWYAFPVSDLIIACLAIPVLLSLLRVTPGKAGKLI